MPLSCWMQLRNEKTKKNTRVLERIAHNNDNDDDDDNNNNYYYCYYYYNCNKLINVNRECLVKYVLVDLTPVSIKPFILINGEKNSNKF